jgi:thioredoxin reductase-like selenoprotein T
MFTKSTKICYNYNIFSFSYSCGYKKAFDDYSNILREKYPEILIEGGNFDPKGFNAYFSKLIVFVKLLLILAIITTFDFFRYLGQPIPSWWRWAIDNKLYACMMIFFLGNMLEAQVITQIWFLFKMNMWVIQKIYFQLISSGAFEIFLNDVPVWSKIQVSYILWAIKSRPFPKVLLCPRKV